MTKKATWRCNWERIERILETQQQMYSEYLELKAATGKELKGGDERAGGDNQEILDLPPAATGKELKETVNHFYA
jgi:hypothetical protein